jgi:putative ATP-dependent endonuclease of OLD family
VRIESIRIQNFRAIEEETIILDDYTCLVGPNGCGKSTVLTALNIFFRESENTATSVVELSREDFHQYNTKEPVTITVTFVDLSKEAQDALKDYVRQGKLIISSVAKFEENSQSAQVRQFGQRLGIEEFGKYFEMEKEGRKASDLKDFYGQLKNKYSTLAAANAKQQMEDALHAYETRHPELCKLLPSADQFYGFSRGVNKIESYLQWVYVPAVKDAATEQAESKSSAIGELLARRVHAQLSIQARVDALKQAAIEGYKTILQENEKGLKHLADALNARFHEWAHHHASLELQWQDLERSINIAKPTAEVKASEGAFKGDLARFGHGLQRSFIFALLQELSEHTDLGPRLVLGCEEPELYQHPPQAKHLASVLQKLSTQNAQVMICTHSPYFVSGRTFENVRLAMKDRNGKVAIKYATYEDVSGKIAVATGTVPVRPGGMAAKIEQEMESPLHDIFFASLRVLVEGQEDVAYISSYLSLLGYWDKFRSLGGHIIRVDGKNHLIQGLAIANQFGLPYFVVFDCDGNTPADTPEKKTGRRQQQEAENKAIFQLAQAKNTDSFPKSVVLEATTAAWPNTIADVVEEEIGREEIAKIKDKVVAAHGFSGYMGKNPLFIGYVMAEAWEQNLKSKTLIALCEALLKLGRSLSPVPAKDALAVVAATQGVQPPLAFRAPTNAAGPGA